jgi:hypothetical protein
VKTYVFLLVHQQAAALEMKEHRLFQKRLL